MNNGQNDYDFNNGQSVFTAPVDKGYDLHEKVDDAFGKGLASVIMASFPIASIIAISFGSRAVNAVDEARYQAKARGIKLSGKNIAARVLGKIGNIAGIVMTVYYCIMISIWLIYIISMVMSGIEFAGSML